MSVSDLKIREAVLGEHDDYPTFTRDMIELVSGAREIRFIYS